MADAFAILENDRHAGSISATGNTFGSTGRKQSRRAAGDGSGTSSASKIVSLQDIIKQETAEKKVAGPKKPVAPTGADLLRRQGFKVPREILNIVSDESVNPMLVMQIASDFHQSFQQNQQQQQGGGGAGIGGNGITGAAAGAAWLGARKLLRPVRKFLRREFHPRADLNLQRWVREDKLPESNAFEKLNVPPGVLEYTDGEYDEVIAVATADDGDWSKAATDELLRMLRLYHFRWHAVQDNWDADAYGPKTLEDLRERYYDVYNTLEKHRAGLENRQAVFVGYDAEHERRRKEQLEALWNRTPEQVEEDRQLRADLKKIEALRREREVKARKIQEQAARLDRQAVSTAELTRQHHSHRGRPGTSRKSNPVPSLATNSITANGGGGSGAVNGGGGMLSSSQTGGLTTSKKSSATSSLHSSKGAVASGGLTKKGGDSKKRKAESMFSDAGQPSSSKKGGSGSNNKNVKNSKGKLRHSTPGGGSGGKAGGDGGYAGEGAYHRSTSSSNNTNKHLSASSSVDADGFAALPPEIASIRFGEVKPQNVTSMRSSSRVPNTLGTKKAEAMYAMLEAEFPWLPPGYYLPVSTESTVVRYNKLRNILLAIYEHKQALMNEVYDASQIITELHTLNVTDAATMEDRISQLAEYVERKNYPAKGGATAAAAAAAVASTTSVAAGSSSESTAAAVSTTKRFMNAIDTEKHYPAQRQRKAAVEQQKLMKTLKRNAA